MEEPQQHIQVEKKELLIVASLMLGVLMLMVLTSLRDSRTRQKSQAQTPVEIGIQTLSPLSEVELSEESASVDLRSNTENGTQVLYDATATGEAAVFEFMDKNPLIDASALSNDTQVQGVSTDGTKQRVLPANFRQNSVLSRTLNDKMFKNKQEIKHYYYSQKINNIPVFGSTVRFDVAGTDKVVGVEGDYTLSSSVSKVTLTEQQGIEKALEQASVDMSVTTAAATPVVCSDTPVSQKIYNEKILGISSNETNNVVLEVMACDGNNVAYHTFRHLYLVSLDTGAILADGDQIYEAINRKVYNCKTVGCSQDLYGRVTSRGSVTRSESQGPVGESNIDASYDILGDVYNFFFNSFARDGIDNHGGALIGYVYAPVANAQWDGTAMSASANYIGKDIWAHELMHGVTQHTSGLGPLRTQYQARGLNESISDMFAYGVDPANWTMGETSRAGTIRDIANPRLFGQPERIFDSGFSCTGEEHKINGPTNKAFNLMTAGGTFNGCTINGIGKEKSLAVIYKANTTYLRQSSGFFDFNNKVNQACGELYGASSSECANVAAAMQATELDQDRCGAGKSRSTPICAGGTQPTVGQTQPTVTQPTAGAQATVAPTAAQGGVNTNPTVPPAVPTVSAKSGAYFQLNPSAVTTDIDQTIRLDLVLATGQDQVATADAKISYDPDMLEAVDFIDGSYMAIKKDASRRGIVSVSATVDVASPVSGSGILGQLVFKVIGNGTSNITFTCVPGVITDSNIFKAGASVADIIQCSSNAPAAISSGKGVTLDLALHFQGVDRAFGRSGGSIPIQVGITGDNLPEPVTQLVQFSANAQGVVIGTASFPTIVAGNYCISIKGPLHSRRRVCHKTPLEAQTGEYRRGSSTIPLTNGINELDFTGISMMSGDIDQNGVVNSFDLLSVRNSIGSTNQADIDHCDVNYDGACNGTDWGLVVGAILIKTDE